MNEAQMTAIGLQHGLSLARSFYQLTLETFHATDFIGLQDSKWMTSNYAKNTFLQVFPVRALQATCIVLPCAHAFGYEILIRENSLHCSNFS